MSKHRIVRFKVSTEILRVKWYKLINYKINENQENLFSKVNIMLVHEPSK